MAYDQLQPNEDDPIPGIERWSWAMLEMILIALAANAHSRAMAHHLVQATRLESPFLPPEGVRQQLAMIFAALVDPAFPIQGRPPMP